MIRAKDITPIFQVALTAALAAADAKALFGYSGLAGAPVLTSYHPLTSPLAVPAISSAYATPAIAARSAICCSSFCCIGQPLLLQPLLYQAREGCCSSRLLLQPLLLPEHCCFSRCCSSHCRLLLLQPLLVQPLLLQLLLLLLLLVHVASSNITPKMSLEATSMDMTTPTPPSMRVPNQFLEVMLSRDFTLSTMGLEDRDVLTM